MEKIAHYVSVINDAIKQNTSSKEPKELYEPIDYILDLGGKRIRPALLLLANEVFGGKTENAINAALAIEVFHNFTLVHDDIMDEAPIRRGKATVHKKWNRDIAILSGDVMLVQAIQFLSKCSTKHLPIILQIFNETAVQVCEGQQYDMNFETTEQVSINDYLLMIEHKTAVLLGASLKIGAVLANAKEEDANHIYEFGKNLGIAFQLMDDILDLYGDPKKVGKRMGGDIISNKKTYLLLKAQELTTGKLKKELDFCLTSTALEKDKKVQRVKSIFDQMNIKKLAIDEMTLFYNTSLANLDSIDLPKEKKIIFEKFAEKLMNRES